MIQIPAIVVKSLATCTRREEAILKAIIEGEAEANQRRPKARTLRGQIVAWTKQVGLECLVFRYRVLRVQYNTVYLAHD